jgi:23S rRNA (adenine2503-C2)-methyltransferase
VPTWEPPTPTRDRVVAAVRRLGSTHDGDLVLVGHGTAWTLLVAELTGRPPDLDAWERLAMRPVSRSEGGRQPQGASRRAAAGKATTASADSGWETGAEMSDQPKSLPLVFDEPRGRGKPPRHLADLSADDRLALVTDLGLPGYRAKQLSTHYFVRLVDDAAEMTDLPATDREQVVAALLPTLMTPLRTLEADKGTTRKTLWKLFDGALVESVLMRYPDRVTLCVSSQAGCGMACPFCATGQGGLQRNMSAAEIVEQVVAGARSLVRGEVPGGPGRVSNVVFMGMGEPMANYKAVIGAIRRLTDKAPDGLGMSARGITLSTVGLVPRINQLADEGIPVTLALSLHAPDDELRNELVPINTRWSVHEAVEAAWNYARITKRRVSIEYAMMCDINDQAWRADLLGDLLTSYGDWGWVHVNLIPLNPTPGSKWTASRPEVEREFVRRLEAKGVPTTVRDTRGSEIDGACGQLAAVDS